MEEPSPASARPRVAIVGSGIAGLTAVLGLQDACDTVLYEASDRLGGHILPVAVPDPAGRPAAVDTGFTVFVPETYPQLTQLLAWLGVEHAPAPTRFRITDELRALSFEPGELLGLCGTRLPAACRRDLLRVGQTLLELRRRGPDIVDNVSLAEWVARQGFQAESVELGVLPWVASFWGLQPETVLGVSARVALREIARNAGPYQMHCVRPSSQRYLARLLERLRCAVRHQPVERVELAERPLVWTAAGVEAFDRVIVATAADDARALLTNAPASVHAGLAVFHYEPTVAVLHRDTRRLPADRADWRTFHHRRRRDPDRVRSVTTWVMDLLHEWHADPSAIDSPTLLSTGDTGLVDAGLVDPQQTLAVFRHRHLVMTPAVVDALPGLPHLDEDAAFTLAGSYAGLGALHEDALGSGMRAADKVRRELGRPPMAWPWAARPAERPAERPAARDASNH
jgi:uncharacterized protein